MPVKSEALTAVHTAMNTKTLHSHLQFMSGGGEMGALTRATNWSQTSLGDPGQWPASLKTTLSIMLKSSFPMFLWWGPELTCFYNDAYRPSLGNNGKHPSILGMPAKDAWPEIWDTIKPLIDQVLTEGEAVYFEDRLIPIYRNGRMEDVYWTFSYSPVYDDGGVSGVLVTCVETTDKVFIKKRLEESEDRFRDLIAQWPIPMVVLKGPDHVIDIVNNAMVKRWKKPMEYLAGKRLADVFPEIGQQYIKLLDQVYTTGKSYQETDSVSFIQDPGNPHTSYVDFEYVPLLGNDGKIAGVIATVHDVTERVQARHKIENSSLHFRNLIMQSPVPKAILRGKDHIVEMANDALLKKIWKREEGEVVGKKLLEIFPELKEQSYAEILDSVYNTAEKWTENEAQLMIKGSNDTEQFYVDFEFAPLIEADKTVSGIKITAIDVTEKVLARLKIEESERKFRLLADSMPQHIWTADAQGTLNYFNRSLLDYSGLEPQQIPEGGWLQIVHPDDKQPSIAAWAKALFTGEDFLLEHRFRKYNGEYRWQLSRALPQRDEDGNIQMWVGSSTDIQEQKSFSEELEKEVNERTKELEQKNSELEQMNKELQSFAYISSHDLQEPLRKIQTFSTFLLKSEHENLTERGKEHFRRMQLAAERMQLLIDDLLAYSRTSNAERKFEQIDFSKIVDEVKDDLNEDIKKKKATIDVTESCVVNVIPFQFRQLLQNLIANALKFVSPERPPHIIISARIEKGAALNYDVPRPGNDYIHISVADNGIGFEQEYSTKIFELFQRLHGRSEYPGTGIGLAIVKKIVENHNGIITAKGAPGAGATFDIYIPAV